MTSLSQECDVVTQSCPLHLTIEPPCRPVRFLMPFIVFPRGGDVVIILQKILRDKLGIDVMAQLKAWVLKARGRENGPEMKITDDGAVGEPNAGGVVRTAMAVTSFGAGGDATGHVDDDVTLTLLSQRCMMFQDSEVEVQDRVARWRQRSMTLLTMAYGRNVLTCCAISFFAVFARTLTCTVGRCWATRLRTWSL